MWIVTDVGYFSFVVDRKDPSQVWLRARVREDLARNFPGIEIIEKPGADYYFRAKISKADLAARMTELIMVADITGHFKDEALKRSAIPTHGSRRDLMYGFWNHGAAMQPYAPYSKVPRAPRPAYKPVAKPYLSRPSEHGINLVAGTTRAPDGSVTAYGRDFDWSTHPQSASFSDVPEIDYSFPVTSSLDTMSDEEFARLTRDQIDAILDAEEQQARLADEQAAWLDEDGGAAAAQDDWLPETEPLTYTPANGYPAPRQPSRRERRAARKGKRRNRHNQN